MYKLIFSKFLFRLKDLNYIQIGSGIYLVLIFLPLIPSGAFFSDYLITMFILNLGIFYGSNPNFNIFNHRTKSSLVFKLTNLISSVISSFFKRTEDNPISHDVKRFL